MKKSLIAASASAVALAAIPAIGTFAVTNGQTLQDTINLNITETCNFTRATTTPHAAGTTASGGSWSNDAFTATITPGEYASLAKSSYAVSCNDPDGYQVTVATTGFTSSTVDSEAFPWAYSNGGSIVTSGDSMWFLTVTGTDTPDAATIGTDLTNDIIAKRTKATPAQGSNDSFDITYGVFVDNNQAAGSYQATATYTFAQLKDDGTVQPAN